MTDQRILAFRTTVRAYFRKHGRSHLPWRKTHDPYRILVSELMLQQTQVDRVISKYQSFLKKFPTIRVLASATLGDVLREWQGLGYNRRAKMLWQAAQNVSEKYKGKLPRTVEDLEALPGIGPYTARAVMAFAYNAPVVCIETNIRAAFIHHFFPSRDAVRDTELLPCIAAALDTKNPRQWYAALMDYGSYLKKTNGNASRRSAHHVPQKKFKGSDREIRGAILRTLATRSKLETLAFSKARIKSQLAALQKEGLIISRRGAYILP